MVIYIVVFITTILLVPIFTNVFIFYDGSEKRLNFSIYLFKLLKIFGGFVEIEDKSLYLHYRNKRTLLFKRDDVKMKKGSLKSIFAIELLELSCAVYTPLNNQAIVGVGLINNLQTIFFPIIKTAKPFAQLYCQYKIGYLDNLKIYLKISLCFNLITIISILIKRSLNEK